MKMTVDGCATSRNVTSKARRFNMKPTAKSFQILSAGIYTNHVAAIWRELGCNAADSHSDNGNPTVPIQVHIPNTFEPFLSVEDTDGLGLDDIQIRGQYVCPNCDNTENSDFDEEKCPNCGCKLTEANYEPGIYTTYFDSDKVDNDEVTGCLGLGSKSPLAYTDQFSVTAVKNGEKNVYSAFLDDEGMPSIVRLHSEETDAPNGVKVEVGVNPDDFDKFLDEARYVYQWFATKPIITGVDEDEFEWPDDQSFLMETDDYGIVDKTFDTYSSGGSTNVLMGNVRYTLNYGDFDYKTREKFTEVEAMLLKHGIFLKVPLSEGCDVAASREKLQMTKRSVETIKRKLAIAEADCLIEAQKRIDECETLWDARIKCGELTAKTILGKIAKLSKVELTWKGRECKPTVDFTKSVEESYLEPLDNSHLIVSGSDEIELHGPLQTKTRTINKIVAKGMICYLRETRRGFSGEIFSKENTQSINVGNDTRIFVQDVAHGSYSAVERLLRDDYTVKCVYLLQDTDRGTLDQFLVDTGLGEVVENVSTLPKPERSKRSKSAKKTAKAVVFCGQRHGHKSSYMWDDHHIEDIDEGGVYVEVHRYNWRAGKLSQRGDEFVEPCHLYYDVQRAKKLDPDMGQVIGLRKALVKKIENNPKWVRLDQHIINKVKANEALASEASCYAVWQAVSLANDNVSEIMDRLEGRDWATHSVLNSLIRDTQMFRECGTPEVIAFKEMRSHYGYLVNEFLEKPMDYTSLIDDLKKRWGSLNESYPMLSFVKWNWSLKGKVETAVDYINLVDGHTPKKVDDTQAA